MQILRSFRIDSVRTGVTTIVCASIGFLAPLAAAQDCPEHWLPGTGIRGVGSARAMVRWDPDGPGPMAEKIVVGGPMTMAGPIAVNRIAAYDTGSGEWEALGTGLTGGSGDQVHAIVETLDRDLIVAGTFTTAGGQPCSRIARWDGQAWHPLHGGLDGTVRSLARLPNGDIIAAGEFMTANGIEAARIARWDGEQWYPLGAGLSGAARDLAVTTDGHLVVVGMFDQAGENPAHRVAVWDGVSWGPLGDGLFTSELRTVCVLADGRIVAGGSEGSGAIDEGLALWDGTAWQPMCITNSATIYDTAPLADGSLLVGVRPGSIDGTAVGPVALWNGAAWSAAAPGDSFSGTVYSVLPGQSLLIGGAFSAGAAAASGFAAWDGDRWLAFGTGFNGQISSFLAIGPTEIYAGGSFTFAVDTPARSIARFDGQRWHALGDGLDGFDSDVRAMALHGSGDLIAGGAFEYSGAAAMTDIARWDGTTWHPMGPPMTPSSSSVQCMATLPNGDVVVGGTFTSIGGVAATNVAVWDGLSWAPLGAGLSSGPRCFAVLPDGTLIAGGSFSASGSTPIARIARWDGASWSQFGPGLSSAVEGLAVLPSGELVAVGHFVGSGPPAFRYAARWDGTKWLPLGSPQDAVRAVALLQDGTIVAAGGVFNSLFVDVRGIARWDGSAWRPMGSIPSQLQPTLLVVPETDDVLLNATVTASDGRPSAYLSRYTFGGGTPFTITRHPPAAITVCSGDTVLVTVEAVGNAPLTYLWRSLSLPIDPVTNPSATTATLRIEDIELGPHRVFCEVSDACGVHRSTETHVYAAWGPPYCCRADWDRSGGVDGDDIAAFFEDWQMGEADIDQSGGTDGDDISFFFTRWQAGC